MPTVDFEVYLDTNAPAAERATAFAELLANEDAAGTFDEIRQAATDLAVQALRRYGFDARAEALILGGNLARILGLD